MALCTICGGFLYSKSIRLMMFFALQYSGIYKASYEYIATSGNISSPFNIAEKKRPIAIAVSKHNSRILLL